MIEILLRNDRRIKPTADRDSLILCSAIPPWSSEGSTILESVMLHNNRLNADATVPAVNLLAVASRRRWPSQLHQGGAGEPQSVRAIRSYLYTKGIVRQSIMLHLSFHAQGPLVPPGAPTAQNKERARATKCFGTGPES